MFKLDKEKQISVTKENITAILNQYGFYDFTFELITEGISNTSLIIKTSKEKYILRIYAQSRNSDASIRKELSFQDYLRSNDIPIPKVYKNIKGEELTVIELNGKPWQVILMEFIEGESVTFDASPELVVELARMQAKMHLLGIEFAKKINKPKEIWKDLHDSLAQNIDVAPINSKEVLGFIERARFFRYKLNPELSYGYNHLDVDFDGNIITKENKIQAVIDFEDLKYSPIVVCLGYTLWNIWNDEGLEGMKNYLREYKKIRPLSILEKEALPHAIFFRNYVIGIIRLLSLEDQTETREIKEVLELEKEIPRYFGIEVSATM